MQKWYSLLTKGILVFILGVTFEMVSGTDAVAQYPRVPVLSLTGSVNRFNTNLYPDGRIWVSRPESGSNRRRELLVPVFIRNQWGPGIGAPGLIPSPITSFQFHVQYDSSMLIFRGVQHFGQRLSDTIPSVARDFKLEAEDVRDTTYWNAIDPSKLINDKLRGRKVIVTGRSSKGLPLTEDPNQPFSADMQVLLYLNFDVRGFPANDPQFTPNSTPLIMTNDSIRYNDYLVGHDLPFATEWQSSATLRNLLQFQIGGSNGIPVTAGGLYSVYKVEYNVPQSVPMPWTGLGLGGVTTQVIIGGNDISIPGVIYVQASTDIPVLQFRDWPNDQENLKVLENPNNPAQDMSQWIMTSPITVDSGSSNPPDGRREIKLINSQSGTRLNELAIVSDQPWLRFQTFATNDPFGRVMPNTLSNGETRYIPYIDNRILGTSTGYDPADHTQRTYTVVDPQINFRIVCDPSRIRGEAGEYAGIYTGYLTFSSQWMKVTPVRLKVTFIYLRKPDERSIDRPDGGIRLVVRNSRGQIGDTNILIFGTGHRATDGPDSLFGEYAHGFGDFITGFGARWFTPWVKDAGGFELYPEGFGDFAANEENRRSQSRDIRDQHSDTTLIYFARFRTPNVADYPIVLSWDVADFPEGSQLYLRDSLNGSIFGVDMRNATLVGGTEYSFTIRDATIKSFVIEYTRPNEFALGNTFMRANEGWNLLSLPVKPATPDYRISYPNALNIPFYFSQNQYQSAPDIRPGTGYFIKYGKFIDNTIAGARLTRIDRDFHPSRVFQGWNTIGGLSVRVPVKDIDFQTIFNDPLPIRTSGVYGYVTDRGYVEVSEMVPGLGYWMRIENNGYLRLVAPVYAPKAGDVADGKSEVANAATKVFVSDNANHANHLYLTSEQFVDVSRFEMPPLPPADAFDVRFHNNANLAKADEAVIRLNGATYPVRVSIPNTKTTYKVVDAVSGVEYGEITASNPTVVINNSRSNAIKLLAGDVAETGFVVATFPNPMVSSATVAIALPQAEFVTVKVYNSIGVEITTLAQGYKNAGEHLFNFDASSLPSGQYICKIVAGDFTAVRTINIVR